MESYLCVAASPHLGEPSLPLPGPAWLLHQDVDGLWEEVGVGICITGETPHQKASSSGKELAPDSLAAEVLEGLPCNGNDRSLRGLIDWLFHQYTASAY